MNIELTPEELAIVKHAIYAYKDQLDKMWVGAPNDSPRFMIRAIQKERRQATDLNTRMEEL